MWEIIISIIWAIFICKITYNYLENKKAEQDEAIKSILQDLIKTNNLQQTFNDKIHEHLIMGNKLDSSKLTTIDLDQSELNQNLKGKIAKL